MAADDPNSEPAPRPAGGGWTLGLGIVLLLVTRMAQVAALGDVFYYGEELAKGAAAKAMRDGLGVPHHALAYHAYEGGGFVFSHLDAAAFALVGESLLALKLVALTWSLAMLVVGWWAVRRSFGWRAAGCFALLFALAPASFQKLGLLALGIHFEAGLFVLLGLGLLARIALEGSDRARVWFALGATLGFGTYFSYQTVLLVAFAGLVLLVRRRRDALGRLGLATIAGGLVGAAPWFVMLSQVGRDVLDIHGAGLFEGGGALVARHAGMLRSLFAGRALVEQVALAAALLAPALAAAWGLRPGGGGVRRAALLGVVGYLAFFTAVYAASDFAVGPVYHYFRLNRLSQVWLLGTVVLAAGLGSAFERGGAWERRAAVLLLGLLALIGLAGTLRTVRSGVPGPWLAHLDRLAHTPGYAYPSYLPRVASRLGSTPLERMRTALRFEDAHPDRLRAEIAGAMLAGTGTDLEGLVRLARELDPDRWPEFLRGSGALWSRLHGLEIDGRWRALAEVEEPAASALAEAQGRFGEGYRVTRVALQREIERALALGVSDEWLRGLGWRAWDVLGHAGPEGLARDPPPAFALDREAARAFLLAQPAAARAALLAGWERARRERTLP